MINYDFYQGLNVLHTAFAKVTLKSNQSVFVKDTKTVSW